MGHTLLTSPENNSPIHPYLSCLPNDAPFNPLLPNNYQTTGSTLDLTTLSHASKSVPTQSPPSECPSLSVCLAKPYASSRLRSHPSVQAGAPVGSTIPSSLQTPLVNRRRGIVNIKINNRLSFHPSPPPPTSLDAYWGQGQSYSSLYSKHNALHVTGAQ